MKIIDFKKEKEILNKKKESLLKKRKILKKLEKNDTNGKSFAYNIMQISKNIKNINKALSYYGR